MGNNERGSIKMYMTDYNYENVTNFFCLSVMGGFNKMLNENVYPSLAF